MDALESLRMSWRNVRDHKLRSTLTTLGVVIGVAAVITFVTLGTSLQADIIQTVAGDNTEVMYVSASAQGEGRLPDLGGGGSAVFTGRDVERLHEVRGVRNVIPIGGIAASTVSFRNDTVGRQWVTVATPRYFPAKGIDFVAGRPYAEDRSEVVLNEQAASMFGENVTVGDTLNLTRAANGESLAGEVVGIVRESSGSRQSFLGGSGGPAVYAPTDPFYERTIPSPTARGDEKVYSRLLVTATDVQVIEEVQGRVFAHLTEESDARILKPEGYQFEVTTYDQLVDQIREVSNTFTAYISGIALVSLVVGAIGIANIMLVSVTERTREIGIMKAVGATRGDILQIFLAEAVILGALGSILGTLLGLAGGFVGTSLIFLPLRFEIQWAVVAVLVGVLVGVAAGLYPAWNAARIDPIDALRHE